MRQSNINHDWLAFFRIGTAAFCLVHFLTLIPDIDYFIGYSSFVHAQILRPYTSQIVPALYDIAHLTGDGQTMKTTLLFFEVSYILSLLLLLTGTFTRMAALLSSLLHLVLLTSFEIYSYGVDYFCSIMLFYCLLFPVGRVRSVDVILNFRWCRPLNKVHSRQWLKLLQIHVCIAYFFGGFDKVMGYNWWNGESIWKAVHLIDSPRLIPVDHLPPFVFITAGWMTIIVEMLYPVFVNIRRTRNVWLVLVCLMHLSIAVFLGLFFFSACMILLNLSAYYAAYTRPSAPARPRGQVREATEVVPQAQLAAWDHQP